MTTDSSGSIDVTLDTNDIMSGFREIIAEQAQQIVVLRATISALDKKLSESISISKLEKTEEKL